MTDEIEPDAPKKRGRPAKPIEPDATELFPCVVLRDYWGDDEARVRAGAIVEVDAVTAMDGISAGILARVKE